MKVKTFGRILTVLSLALLSACSTQLEKEAGEWLSIAVQAQQPDTKTTLAEGVSSTSFSFQNNDKMGFFAEGLLNNIVLTCTSGAGGTFSGRILITGEQTVVHPSVDYYAYYPYSQSAGNNPASLTGTLPATQSAPFDGRADFLVATPLEDRLYDPDAFPALSFEFNKHLFAVVKLSVTNTNAAYEGEELLSIGLKSTGAPLAGKFTFSAVDGSVAFSDDPNFLNDQVQVEYATPPTLGNGTTHSVYAVVNAAAYASGELSLVVNTTNYIFTVPGTKALTLDASKMTAFSTANVGSASKRKRVRTIVLWGDSITGNSLLLAVRNQLGPNWNVVRSGVAGDLAQQVAGRQGGLPLYTGASAFTLPASSGEYVYIDGIYWYYNGAYGQVSHEWTYKSGYTPELNPLIINGIECEISWDTSLGQRRLRRYTDGEAIEIPARTPVSTYGSRAYANADAIAVYIGTNGRPADAIIMDIQDKMKAHLTDPEALMFVWGFHQSTTDMPQYWTSAYVSAFTEHYGNYFIDQRTLGGGVNAVPLMLEMGQITDPSQVTDDDQVYIDRGDWPISWFRKPGDVHPNDQYGAKVMAILLRRRMAQLGLL